jgi:hypothetical protein
MSSGRNSRVGNEAHWKPHSLRPVLSPGERRMQFVRPLLLSARYGELSVAAIMWACIFLPPSQVWKMLTFFGGSRG